MGDQNRSAGFLTSQGSGVWTLLSLQNSWITYGGVYYDPAFKTVQVGGSRVVYFRGLAKNGTITNGTVVATLPAGNRPTEVYSPIPIAAGDANSSWYIDTDGTMQIYGLDSSAELRFDVIPPMWLD